MQGLFKFTTTGPSSHFIRTVPLVPLSPMGGSTVKTVPFGVQVSFGGGAMVVVVVVVGTVVVC